MEKKNIKKALLTVVLALVLVFTTVMGTLAYLTDKEEVTNTFTVGNVKITLDEAMVNTIGQPVKVENGQETVVNNLADATRVESNSEDGDSEGNAYHLVPGRVVTKDPTVTLDAASEKAYVRVKVAFMIPDPVGVDANNAALDNSEETMRALVADLLDNVATGETAVPVVIDNTKWIRYDLVENSNAYATVDTTNNIVTVEYRYHSAVEPKKETVGENTTMVAHKLDPVFTQIKVPGAWNNEKLAQYAGMSITVTAHAIQAENFTDAADAWSKFPTT